MCISRVRNPGLKARLVGVTQAVENASATFDAAAGAHVLHEISQEARVGADVTADEMGKVYTQRMAKEGSPGRNIYDAILGATPWKLCPLCAQRSASTLDHHLPKAHYPALAVAPLNLVPACADCNRAKLANVPRTAEDVFLHPYYDDIDGCRWLAAQVVETIPAAVSFHVMAPEAWDATLTARVRSYFRTLDLAGLYGSQAAVELFSIRLELRNLYGIQGINAVQDELSRRAESCCAARRNGWRSAAYRAWANSDWFCDGGFALDE